MTRANEMTSSKYRPIIRRQIFRLESNKSFWQIQLKRHQRYFKRSMEVRDVEKKDVDTFKTWKQMETIHYHQLMPQNNIVSLEQPL